MTDNVDHPGYYGGEDNPYEVIKVAEAWKFDQDAYLFNALKYIARPAKGNHLEDLKKAVWYLERKIGRLEEESSVLENLDGPEAEQSTMHEVPETEDTWPEDAQLTVKWKLQAWSEYATGAETVGEFADLTARGLGLNMDYSYRYTLKFKGYPPLHRTQNLKDVANPGCVLFLTEA